MSTTWLSKFRTTSGDDFHKLVHDLRDVATMGAKLTHLAGPEAWDRFMGKPEEMWQEPNSDRVS